MLAGFFAVVVALYFVPPAEPQLQPALIVLALALAGSLGLFFWRQWVRWLGLLPMLTIAGFACAAWQASRLGDHLLDQTVAGETVTARIEQIVYRPDGPRFLLTDIQGEDIALAGLRRAQIKWRGNGNSDANETLAAGTTALLGQQVRWRLTLLPVRPPVIPGGFDFRRQAFFRGLSAYGYSLGDPVVIGERQPSRVEAFRQTLRERFRRHLKGDAAGLSTALVVGLRGDLSAQTREQIRDAGLAHLLAISGLHVGMVSGALFFLVRLLAALVPGFSLRLPSHRLAALAAILGALGYFLISGGTVPTQRATIVVVLAMGAILISRRPFSLRSLGFAALGVLLLQPAALITASFQMSFAAVLGLIVAFQFSEMRGSGTRPLTGRLLGYA
ncbi:MAG: ComEC/Rec2 family competence protein, partial [Alphaproteobacteria bacterium]